MLYGATLFPYIILPIHMQQQHPLPTPSLHLVHYIIYMTIFYVNGFKSSKTVGIHFWYPTFTPLGYLFKKNYIINYPTLPHSAPLFQSLFISHFTSPAAVFSLTMFKIPTILSSIPPQTFLVCYCSTFHVNRVKYSKTGVIHFWYPTFTPLVY